MDDPRLRIKDLTYENVVGIYEEIRNDIRQLNKNPRDVRACLIDEINNLLTVTERMVAIEQLPY